MVITFALLAKQKIRSRLTHKHHSHRQHIAIRYKKRFLYMTLMHGGFNRIALRNLIAKLVANSIYSKVKRHQIHSAVGVCVHVRTFTLKFQASHL